LSRRKVRREGFVPECGPKLLTTILKAYLSANARENPVHYNEIARNLNIHETTVSRNIKFLVRAKFLQEVTRGTHKLTELGFKYAYDICYDIKDEARDVLRNLLVEYDLTNYVRSVILTRGPVTRDELVKRIASYTGLPLVSRYKTGINTFIDLLIDAGLLIEKDGVLNIEEKLTKEEYIEKSEVPIERISVKQEYSITELKMAHVEIRLRPTIDDIKIARNLLDMFETYILKASEERKQKEKVKSDVEKKLNNYFR